MPRLIDTLTQKIITLRAPIVVGLDPVADKIPTAYFAPHDATVTGVCAAIYDFNKDVIDAVSDIVPAVKPQIAFYEMFGSIGVACFERTAEHAKSRGLVVIEDSKRGDIGNTASAYAQGHLGRVATGGGAVASPYNADFMTVSPYLGEEGLGPFIKVAKEHDKGVFILVRTSNPGGANARDTGATVQNAVGKNGETVGESIARYVAESAADSVGECGYSPIGAVVGATYPEEAAKFRRIMRRSLLLVPGYGAQGGGAADVVPCFNPDGLGAVVNSSRGILYAYLENADRSIDKQSYKETVKTAARQMQTEIYAALREGYPDMGY